MMGKLAGAKVIVSDPTIAQLSERVIKSSTALYTDMTIIRRMKVGGLLRVTFI